MLASPRVCLCGLFYGADTYSSWLAPRLLNAEFIQLGEVADIRLGLNAVADVTRDLIQLGTANIFSDAVVIDEPDNIGKYPMMRQLFNSRPITAPITMWFDDDSCLVPGTDISAWLDRIEKQLTEFAAIGSVYQQRFVGDQIDWIKLQPWYCGLPVPPYAKFISGGWWAIRTDVLQQLNWPPENIKQRGGDVMLGEALRQNGFKIGHFRDGLWINANEDGVEAKAPRRRGIETVAGASLSDGY